MIQKIKKYIKDWESKGYEDGIPDEAPARLEYLGKVPSYKLICSAILKNDIKKLGLSNEKSIYYHLLKQIELSGRN